MARLDTSQHSVGRSRVPDLENKVTRLSAITAASWATKRRTAGARNGASREKAKAQAKANLRVKAKADSKVKAMAKVEPKESTREHLEEEPKQNVEPEAETGGLELGCLDLRAVSWDWSEYQRFNLDTGAAATVFPRSMAGEDFKGQTSGRSFKTASGESIPDYGGLKLKALDESGLKRTANGRVTDVHKALISASQCLGKGGQLCWLDGDGGWIIPRREAIGWALEKQLEKLIAKHGSERLLPIYQENGVYNFYLKVEGKDEINTVGSTANSQASSNAASGQEKIRQGTDFHRQTRQS